MRTDPTDNGGLFIGPRPGTAPVRYRDVPERKAGLRRTFDRLFAATIVGAMMLVRRAASYDQRTGVIGPVFAIAAIVGVTLFTLWFLFMAGPGPEVVGGRP